MADQILNNTTIVDTVYAHTERNAERKKLQFAIQAHDKAIQELEHSILQFMVNTNRKSIAIYLDGTGTVVIYRRGDNNILITENPIEILN